MSETLKPDISVILPLYNQNAYLDRSIRSVLEQSESNIELIIVDDASTDRGYDTSNEFVKRDSRVRLIHKEDNTGPYDARKTGVEMALADRICFIDGDDWYEPHTLSILNRLMKENEADLVQICMRQRMGLLHTRNVDVEDRSIFNRLVTGAEYRSLIKFIGIGSVISPSCCTKIYRRDMLLEAFDHPCSLRWGEDQIMNIHYTRLARNVYLSDFYGYNYRWHSEPGSYHYNTLLDYKEVFRTKLLLGQDPERTAAELRMLWDYHVRQLLTELGWTYEGAINVLNRELHDPVWGQAGITMTAEESVDIQVANIKENPLKYAIKRILR